MKTKAFAIITVALLLSALSLIQTGNAVIGESNWWYEYWHDHADYTSHPQNISTTFSVSSAGGDFWIDAALVVSVYQYNPDDQWDSVNFRVALYFDSFASVALPVTAEWITFFIDKDTDGSDLDHQLIEFQFSDVRPLSQGYGLDQSNWIPSDYDGRAGKALPALATAVGLFLEPIDVAMDLISIADAWFPEGGDYDNAGYDEMWAYSHWRNPGYDFGEQNPVRQYAFNVVKWLQDYDVDPSTYYGIKVSARVGLTWPNPMNLAYFDTDFVYLRICHILTPPNGGSGGGGCPFVSTWCGTEHWLDNNVLPASETSNGTDVEDYYMLQQPLVPYNGKYSLLISEFEQEYSYLDQVRLIAVDHEFDANVGVSPYGDILTYRSPHAPVSAVDEHDSSWLDTISAIDNVYYEGHAGSYLVLNFGDLNILDGAKLVLRSDTPEFQKSPVFIQTLNSTGHWHTRAVIHTRVYWSTDIIDLSEYLPDANGELKIRLQFVSNDKIDYVGLDTSRQDDYELQEANLVSANHSTQGNVKALLIENDNTYAELIPSEQIQLQFTLNNKSGEARTFILYTKGHYYTI